MPILFSYSSNKIIRFIRIHEFDCFTWDISLHMSAYILTQEYHHKRVSACYSASFICINMQNNLFQNIIRNFRRSSILTSALWKIMVRKYLCSWERDHSLSAKCIEIVLGGHCFQRKFHVHDSFATKTISFHVLCR